MKFNTNTIYLLGALCSISGFLGHGDVTATASSSDLLLTKLDSIAETGGECSEYLKETQAILEDNLIEPIETVSEVLDIVNDFLDTTEKIVKHQKKLMKVIQYIPKIGKVVKSSFKVLLRFNKVAKKINKKMTKFDMLLDEKVIPTLEKMASGLDKSSAYLDNGVAAAKASSDALLIAQACAKHGYYDALDAFSSSQAVNEPIDMLEYFSSGCVDTYEDIIESIPDLRVLDKLLDSFRDIMESIGDVVETLEEILDVVESGVTEAVCCGLSPHSQGLLQALTDIIDVGTCWVDPAIDGMEYILMYLVRDLDDIKLINGFNIASLTLPESFSFEPFDIKMNQNKRCSLIADLDITWETHTLQIPALRFDLEELLEVPDEYEAETFFEDVAESCENTASSLDPDDWWGGDCCCQAKDVALPAGTPCLKFEVFFSPGSYEAASAISGLERCTCCENGEYTDAGCTGQTAICGTSSLPNKKIGDTCHGSGVDCTCGTSGLICARATASDADANNYKCCKGGAYGDTDYCYGMKDGSTCWSDAQCDSGHCKGNLGGLQRGTCTAKIREGGSCPSQHNSDCAGNLICGRATAAIYENNFKCCRGGIYAGFDYCYGMKDGSTCWSDAQCASGLCRGNLGGLQRGTCFTKIGEGGSCPSQSNSDCAGSAGCYRTTHYGNYKCCTHQNYCDTWNRGCTTGFWYCSWSGLGR